MKASRPQENIDAITLDSTAQQIENSHIKFGAWNIVAPPFSSLLHTILILVLE